MLVLSKEAQSLLSATLGILGGGSGDISGHSKERGGDGKEGDSESPGGVLSVLSREERGRHGVTKEPLPKVSEQDWAVPREGSFLTRCFWALSFPHQEPKAQRFPGI